MSVGLERLDGRGQRFKAGMRVRHRVGPDYPNGRSPVEDGHDPHEILGSSRFEVSDRRLLEASALGPDR